MKPKTIMLTLCIILAVTGLLGCTSSTKDDETLHIGAVLPLSGPAAIWGESLRDGMALAQKELAQEGIAIDITFEDSQAKATEGITAYNKLVNVDDVDIVFSTFSRVSVPLIPLAEEDETPLIMNIVNAKGVAEQSPYAF